jgi:hypothetical protein
MSRFLTSLFVSIAVLSLFSPAQATVILEDHFNDGVLDPAWSVTTEYVNHWSYSESGTRLTVTDIDPSIISTSTWSRVILSRSFSSLNDFGVDFNFSWDSEGRNDLYQNVYITLYDKTYEPLDQSWRWMSPNTIAYGGYQDPWNVNGQPVASVRGNQMPDPGAILPLTGSASIHISRVDGYLEFYWDNNLLISGYDTAPLSGVGIEF